MPHIHSYKDGDTSVSFHRIDKHAKEIPMDSVYSLGDFMQYMEGAVVPGDVDRTINIARSFLVFLCEINVLRKFREFKVSKTMTEVIYGNPAEAFKILCNKANIECEFIRGKTKSANYQPGTCNIDLLQESSWCAFKSNDTWHLVHPHWTILSVYGFTHGGDRIEGDGRSTQYTSSPSQGQALNAFNDFWFCTNPHVFIHHCYPDNAEWQILSQPYKTIDEFFCMPYLQQGYFEAGLMLLTDYSCTLHSVNGQCIITFAVDKSTATFIELSYSLSLLSGDKSKVNWRDLCQLVMFIPTVDMYTFKVSLPVEGTYSFEITVIADDIVTNASCADFRIECTEACTHCRKVPLNVGIEGFGYGNEAKQAGLKNPSEKTPVVVIIPSEEVVSSDCEDEILNFQIDSDLMDEVEFSSTIISESNATTAHTRAFVDEKRGKLVVKTGMKKRGDFAIAIKAREKKPNADFKTVLNYMVTTNATEKEVFRNHEHVVKQRKRGITKEEKIASKNKQITELRTALQKLQT